MIDNKLYIGRFAPSPSGPLHFGSLIAALGSYLQAKRQDGQWLVRMEDLDPPREMAGAADHILKTLDVYGLHWDSEIVYQSNRHDAYQAQIEAWLQSGQAYACECSRKIIQQAGGFYPGTCRDKKLSVEGQGIRLKQTEPVTSFIDVRYGAMEIPTALAQEDFIIRRRDGLYAYNLAVVLDDIAQGVTEVVRGADLIEPTGRQIGLYRMLNKPEVSYLHLPLAVTPQGYKLSKQNRAPAITADQVVPTLLAAMGVLGLKVKDLQPMPDDRDSLLQWAIKEWHPDLLPNEQSVVEPF